MNASEYRGRSNGVYYTNNQDVTKGNSHYNVAGDVKVTGVDVKTGSVSGTVGGKMTVESVQDEFTSEGRGYSAGISARIGKGFDKNNPKGYGTNLSSISAGHTRTDMEQRITRNVTEFTAGSGFLDVKGTVRQVGSLIDGNFTLNLGGYEHEDLKDIDKSRTVGINVTVYPNVSYSQRDTNGNQVYIDGSNPKKTGTAIKTGFTYGETDKTREILATVGAGVTMNQNLEGVNRDPNRQTTEFEGRELKPVNVDLLTEYWATEAGRGKLRDLIENSERTTDGIKRILTTRDENGNLNVLKNVEAESLVQKFTRIGYVDTKGKTQQQVKQELEARFGSLAKKGVKVYFYGEKDVDTSNLDKNSIAKLAANGFAVTKDGTVWINKSHVDSGKTIDFNTLTQHEISHIVFGDDSEYEAQYVEKAYGQFLQQIKDNGYLTDSQGIIDYRMSMLVDEDWARLNGYSLEDMQYWMPTGDDRIDRRVQYNPYAPEHIQKRQINEIDRLEKAFKKIDKRTANSKVITRLKAKKKISKRENHKLNKETQKIINEELRASEEAEIKKIIKENGIILTSGLFHDGIKKDRRQNRIVIYAGGNDYSKILQEVRELNFGRTVLVEYKNKDNIATMQKILLYEQKNGHRNIMTPYVTKAQAAMVHKTPLDVSMNNLNKYVSNGLITQKEAQSLSKEAGFVSDFVQAYTEIVQPIAYSVTASAMARNMSAGRRPSTSGDFKIETVINDRKIMVEKPIGTAVGQVTPNGYVSAYGRVNGRGAYYSSSPVSSATKPLLQIGHTTGYDLVSRMSATPKYPIVEYKSPVTSLSLTNYFKTQLLVNLVENPKLTVPIIGNKLNYVFGEATGRKHNLERTNEMALTLKGIGINNDTLGGKVVYNNLVNTFHNPHSVTNRESYYNPYDGITYNKTEREAFLMGPAGGVKISSIWWDNELKTVKIYGHRNKAGE